METLGDKLIDIQMRLIAPKDQFNEFGNFKYRNVESIELALKPLLAEHKLLLTLRDDIQAVGDRVFLIATATLTDGKETVITSACAQHALSKTKMDDAQLTGACSSYARKYALGGLFLIDDTKDADSRNNAPKAPQKPQDEELAKAKQKVHETFTKQGVDDAGEMRVTLVDVLGKPTIDTVEDANKVLNKLMDIVT